MRKFLKTLSVLSLSLAALPLSGCDFLKGKEPGDDPSGKVETIAVESVTLDKTNASISLNQTCKLTATVLPENASNKTVTWRSSNEAVAVVDSSGNVVAIGNGTAVITAKAGEVSAFCVVTVGSGAVVNVTGLSLNKTSLTLGVGQSDTLAAIITPSDATNKLVSWTSSDDSVASVSTAGKITAIKVGTAVITATSTDGGKTATCTVTVTSAGPVVDDEEYNIKVNAPDGVTATASATKAKQGTEVTVTLSFETGFKFKKISATGTTLVAVTEGVQYKFTMPDRPVTINVEADVEGDVVIQGEFAAIFQDEGNGLFAARNVEVGTAKERYGFNVVVSNVSVKSQYMDEARCNADMCSGSGSYQFSIAAGATYDFFYDSKTPELGFYAVRKSVQYLPNSVDTLEPLLLGGRMHSQSALHPTGLTSIHYEKVSTDQILDYDFKIFNNNTTFGHAVDKTNPDAHKDYYTWKALDTTNNVYKVATTWPKALGNNEAGDDLWRMDPNNNGTNYGKPYAGMFDVVPTSTADSDFVRMYQMRERDVKRNMIVGAHYGSELEYEIWQSYRGDFTGSAVMGAASAAGSRITVTSEREATGFVTVVDSQLEYNRESDAYEDGAHEGIVYKNTIHFNNAGDMLSMDYTETYYSQSQWDFTHHIPQSGASGRVKKIKVINGYNEDLNPDTGSFNPDDYFISSIEKLSFYNSATNETFDGTKSILNYDDSLELIPMGKGGEKASNVHEFTFLPQTALDGWQYHVDTVADPTVVGVNHQNIPVIKSVGETDVTFSNRVSGDTRNVSKTIVVKGVANGTLNGFYVDCYTKGYDSYNPDNGHAEKLNATAGKTMRYHICASNSKGAPVKYEVLFMGKDKYGNTSYSPTSEYCTVEQTGEVLIMNFDTTTSNSLTSKVAFWILLDSEFYREGFGPTKFEITLSPNYGTVVGTAWRMQRANEQGQVISDYTEALFPNVAADANGYRTARIKDHFFNGTTEIAVDTYTFKYIEDNNNIISDAKVIDVDIQSGDDISKVASDYNLMFNQSQGLAACLSYFTSTWGDEGSDYEFIIGNGVYDSEGYLEVSEFWGFEKVVA